MTSGLYRTDTSIFLFSDFGRPRIDFSGTIALSWLLVSGCASGSALAAAMIFLFSSTEGIRMTRLGVVFGQAVPSAVQLVFDGIEIDQQK